MEELNIFYKGSYTSPLYTAHFDGTNWNGNTKIVDQPGSIDVKSDSAPGAAVLNNWIYLVYRVGGGGPDLYCAWFDGSKWSGGIAINSMNGNINPQSNASPNVTVYQNILYAVYITPNSADVYIAWFNGTTWFGHIKISDLPGGISPQSSANPTIVAYNGMLYIAYLGHDSSDIYVAWFNGATWAGNKKISNMTGGISPQSSNSPSLCVFNGLLYLAYTGSTFVDFYTCTFDGATWRGNYKIENQPGSIDPQSHFNPGIGVFNNKLYLVYPGAAFNDLYTCTFDGTTWNGNTKIGDQPGGISPASSRNPQAIVTATIPGTQPNWLSRLADPVPIGDINLPGTHDSAAISTLRTLYACQNQSITSQLLYGIRMLDVRLKVTMNSATSFDFITCHGDHSLGIGLNEYQSFSSLMDECKSFLAANPTETILMTLKVDDWGNVGSFQLAAYDALKRLLGNYPTFVPTNMPALGTVRGKIVLYNRITTGTDFGAPLGWNDNTSGSYSLYYGTVKYNVYVQDQYKDLPTAGSEQAKLDLVTRAFAQKVPGTPVLNFASATWFGAIGVYIMDDLLNYFGQYAAAQRPTKLGWTLFDYPFNTYVTDKYAGLNIVTMVIASNFNYASYPDKFRIV